MAADVITISDQKRVIALNISSMFDYHHQMEENTMF